MGIIDISESVQDVRDSLIKTFGLSQEQLDSDGGKNAIADLTRIYIQHDYLAWLTNHPIESSVMAARMATVFHRYKFADAYVKCKDYSEALIHIEGFSDEDDVPEHLMRQQFEFEDFVETAFCEEDLTNSLTSSKGSREVVYQISRVKGEAAKYRFLNTEMVVALSSVLRGCFKNSTEYNNTIRSIVISD